MAVKRTYPTDLSDAEWEILSQLIPPAKKGGHPRITSMREVCNGIYYHLKTGCAWQFLPRDFPPPSTVYNYYRKWQKKGVWEKMNQQLREKVRLASGKDKQCTVAIADSQSVKTTEKRGKYTVSMGINK